MLRGFREDPFFLLRYYLYSTAALGAAILALNHLQQFSPGNGLWFLVFLPLLLNSFAGMILTAALALSASFYYHGAELRPWQSLLVPAGIYFGMLAVQLIHNCAHRSFRPRWLNRGIGELLAVHLLSGFPGFVILHLQHHQYPDDPEHDPHPNGDLSFWQYFFSIKGKLRAHFERVYFQTWGRNPRSEKIWRASRALLPINRVLRAYFLFLVAGPLGFSLFFLPSFVSNQITFAHINFFTHRRDENGEAIVVNLNHSWVYRFLNRIMFGGYMHKNHHLAPWLFNPARFEEPRNKRLA